MTTDMNADRDWGMDISTPPETAITPLPGRASTVANWVEEYKAVCQQRLAPMSMSALNIPLKEFALWCGTRTLSKDMVVKYCDYLRSVSHKRFSLIRRFSPLRPFLRWCYQMEHIKTEMAFLVPTIRITPPDPKRFSPEQYAALKELSKGTVWHYASIMSYRTGMRLSDVCLLKWEHINLEEMFIAYTPFKTRRKGIRALCPIESGGDLHEIILDMSNARSKHPIWSTYVCPDLAMYYPKDGGPLAIRATGCRTFKYFCKRIGARHLSFHKLRNSFMSRVVDADLNWMKVCQITGLRTFAVMMRYAKPDANVLRKDMEKLSQIESEQAVAGEMKLIAQPLNPKQLT